jgi:hypothetical protein
MRPWLVYVALALSVSFGCETDEAAGGDDSSGAELSSCQSTAEAWSGIVAEVFGAHDACAARVDCRTEAYTLACSSGASLGDCPMAIATSQGDAAMAALDERGTAFCEDIEGPCVSSASCVPSVPDCVFGHCVARTALSCNEANYAWEMTVAAVFAEHAACDVDTDCTLSDHTLSCDDEVTLTHCPLPLATASADAAQTILNTESPAFCAVVERPCMVLANKCAQATAICDAGTCTLQMITDR